ARVDLLWKTPARWLSVKWSAGGLRVTFSALHDRTPAPTWRWSVLLNLRAQADILGQTGRRVALLYVAALIRLHHCYRPGAPFVTVCGWRHSHNASPGGTSDQRLEQSRPGRRGQLQAERLVGREPAG